MNRKQKHHFDNVRRSVKFAHLRMNERLLPGWRNRLALFMSGEPKGRVNDVAIAFLCQEYGVER